MLAARTGALLALLVFSTSTFAAPPVKFGVQVDLTGNGTVTSSPGGISCPTSCLAYFKQAATITLTAAPAAGETFLGWGGACSGTGSCTIPSIQGDVQVAAQFSSNGGGGGGGGMTMVPEGTEPNSLLYWNGVAWAELLPPAGTADSNVLSINAGGLEWTLQPTVVNGGFEVGGSGCQIRLTALPGWTVEAGNLDRLSRCPTYEPPEGEYYIDLLGTDSPALISQEIGTTPGTTYRLSFLFGGNSEWQCTGYQNDSPIKTIRVSAGPVIREFSIDTAQSSACQDFMWRERSVYFTAESDATIISFQSLNSPGVYGPMLDKVEIVRIP